MSRALCNIIGQIRVDTPEQGERLEPVDKETLSFNLEPGDDVDIGDVVDLTIRVRVLSLLPNSLPKI